MQRVWRGSADASVSAGPAAPPAPGWDEQRAAAARGPAAQEQRVQYTMLPWANPQAAYEIVRQGASRHVAAANNLHVPSQVESMHEKQQSGFSHWLASAVEHQATKQFARSTLQHKVATLSGDTTLVMLTYDITPTCCAEMKSRLR